MSDKELLLLLHERLDNIDQRLREGDDRMTRIEANIGLAMNAAAAALDHAGHTDAAKKVTEQIEGLRAPRNGRDDDKTDPGIRQ